MELSLEEAVTLCINKLLRNGVPREEAEIAAPIYLEGELWGKQTHGFRYLIPCLNIYRCAREQRQTPTVERETAVSAVVNGGFHFPAFVHNMAMKLAITKAKQSGMAMVGVYNAGPSGLLGYYSQLATESDLIGVAINGTSPFAVPPHGITPMLGTNPLTIGVPRTGQSPLILDMSTSSITYNQVLMAQHKNIPLPDGVALDEEGNVTTDPSRTLDATKHTRILPFAGYKGFGLSFMIELLSTAGLGTRVVRDKLTSLDEESSLYSGTYLAYRPDLFVERAVFDTQVTHLVADIKANHVAGHAETRLPGEQSQQHKAAVLQRNYIEIDESTYAFLQTE